MKDLSSSQLKKNVSTKIHPIIVYSLETCPYCKSALSLLDSHKIKYNKIIVENDPKIKEKYKKLCEMNTFPMIFIQHYDDKNKYIKIGGYSDLQKYIDLTIQLRENNIHISILNSLDQLF
jgi:glutaredoxin